MCKNSAKNNAMKRTPAAVVQTRAHDTGGRTESVQEFPAGWPFA